VFGVTLQNLGGGMAELVVLASGNDDNMGFTAFRKASVEEVLLPW
jgi:hypothetical protein